MKRFQLAQQDANVRRVQEARVVTAPHLFQPGIRGSGLRQVQKAKDNKSCLRALSIPGIQRPLRVRRLGRRPSRQLLDLDRRHGRVLPAGSAVLGNSGGECRPYLPAEALDLTRFSGRERYVGIAQARNGHDPASRCAP